MIAMKKRVNGMRKRKKYHFSLANPMVGPIFVLRKRFAGHLANWIYAYNIVITSQTNYSPWKIKNRTTDS